MTAFDQEHAQRLESVGQLAGGVAHDFNNLLAVIIGNSDLLAAQMDRDAPGSAELLEIRRAAARAAELTRQLLTFSRADETVPESVDLNRVVVDASRMLRRVLGERVTVELELARELPAVTADPGAVEQVLVNLCVNARDAMASGGLVCIATRERNGCVELSVQDDGVGMPPEVLERVTDAFFTTKPKDRGTGLGLSTVNSIVQRAHGTLEIQSTEGLGTKVTVSLPPSATPPLEEAPAQVPVRGDGRQILLVEDDDAVRRVAVRILERNGFTVRSVHGPLPALTVLENGTRPDVLLTDVVMPAMPGSELALRARRLAPGLPVVFMSGYVDPELDLEQVAGAHIVRKPFTEASLTAALAAALV